MMGGLDNCISRLLQCFLLCLFLILLLQSTYAQQGFESIQCCALKNITDHQTNINWVSDLDWFRDKECQGLSIPVVNDTSYGFARIFGTGLGNKWCYKLNTTKNQDYLIRGTFLRGSLLHLPPDTFFKVSVSVTSISLVNISDFFEVEGIFRATNHHINFCLVKGKGNPYLSKLELRPLSPLYLNSTDPSSVLKVVSRVDLGNTIGEIRYPNDSSDRIWRNRPDQNKNATAIPPLNASISFNYSTTSIPIEVLQTALTDSKRLDFQHNDLDTTDNNYLIFLYFLELNDSVKMGQRVFDIYANGVKKKENFDILANGYTSKYSEVVFNAAANGVLNVSLVKVPDGSELGPICNAYEILQVHTWVQGTVQKDVEAIVKVRDKLLAENPENELLWSWSGDPCLPLPWQALACEPGKGSFVITKLDLSSKDLQGLLPVAIPELTHLKELNLSFNSLTGNIPPFPASSMLTSVDMSNNELLGSIPDSLATLPHLEILYFGCNPHFSNELPSGFNYLNLTTDSGKCGQSPSHSSPRILIGSVACGSLLFTVAVGVIFICFYRQRLIARGILKEIEHPMSKNAVFSIPSMDDISLKSIFIQQFTLECIEAATNNYKTLIGEGGFGSVYRGTLLDGQEVAVKVRSATSTQGTREFDNELNLLSAIRHENLVPLLGSCCENDQQILVYPFMSNGSLQDRLYGDAAKRKTLDWATRLSIALGAARGLLHLHTFAGRCIIHRDVKSSNILMDHSMCAKVADFGFSKYAPQEGDSGASLEVRGTAGYLDPEYYSTQHLSVKSDVFSFGVVLLEIISGREPLNIHRPRNEWSLVEWAKPLIRDSKMEDIVDPSIKGGYHAEAMWRVVEMALLCIEPFSAYRPCMADIVRELEDALIIENNASEYMKSIDSFGGSNRFSSVEKKIPLPVTPTPTEPSPIISQVLAPPQPR